MAHTESSMDSTVFNEAGDTEAHAYDRMAFDVQHPDQKPNWHVFLGGKQGIGKNLFDSNGLPKLPEYRLSINSMGIFGGKQY